MRNQAILLSLLASLTASGCNPLECAEGTIERDGRCEPSTGGAVESMCGPFTELQGDRCVPTFPPTVCEDGADSELDPETGVTTCKGGGLAPCGFPVTCSAPSGATKQSFCGQIYNFETNVPFGDPDGTPGVPCATDATTGPCALQLLAYDALVFADNPQTAMQLSVGEVVIDNCGRFQVKNVETSGTGPFIGIGLDDARMALGPAGQTVTVATASPKQPGVATKDLEHWIVPAATVQKWANMPPLSGGIYAPIFRQHKIGNGDRFALQSGVTVTKSGNTIPANDFYFTDTTDDRTMVSSTQAATGANGTALISGAVAADGLVYTGQGGVGAGCRWEDRAGASLPGIVFIQVFRKLDIVGQTCND